MDKKLEALEEVLQSCINEMENLDDTECDHDVGICWCSWWRVINRAKDVLKRG